MLNVLITDDHQIFREGMKQFINREVDMKVCCEASSGEEAIQLIMDKDINVVILDIGLPGRNGLDILQDIRKIKPKLPVLVFSMYPEENYAVRAFKAGADGYLSKDSFDTELIDAIRTISQNKKYITSSIAEKLASELSNPKNDLPHNALSDREFEVAKLIASGKSIKEISVLLNLSPNTVNTYRKRVLTKLSLNSNVELAIYAYQHNLLD